MSLREQQAALMAALSGTGPLQPGWAADRVRATARALAQKRAHSVGLAWPSLRDMLGDNFDECFAHYAADKPLLPDGPMADGRRFARWLEGTQALTDAVRWQALAIDLRFRHTGDRWQARRGPCLRAVRLPTTGCWALALRIPGVVERRWALRWRISRHRAHAS